MSKIKGKMMYVPASVLEQLDRLKQMNNNINVWDAFQQHAQVGLELETNFGWLFRKAKR